MAACGALALPAGGASAETRSDLAAASIERYGGADRYATSLLVAEAVAAQAGGVLEEIVLVSGRNWTDAVVAAPLAGSLGAAVLATPPGELRADAAGFLERTGVSNAVLIGANSDTNGVGPSVVSAVNRLGITTLRITRADQYETAAAVAYEMGEPGDMDGFGRTAVVASGEVFPDALVAGAFAARGRHPVLLTPAGELHDSAARYLRDLQVEHVVLMGGTAALGSDVEASIEALGIGVTRLAGTTRYDTAVKAAELTAGRYGSGCFSAQRIGLARARVPFDSFSAGPLLGRLCAPLLLAEPGGIPDDTAAFLDRARRNAAEAGRATVDLHVFGGHAAVSQDALADYELSTIWTPSGVRAAYTPGQTGISVAGTEAFDRLIPAFMAKWDVPGAAVAIAKDGRLVFAKGYGFADAENEEPLLPDALFRIGSISKPVTAVAILKLVEDGLLDLDERAFDILDHIEPTGGEIKDARYREVTVRQLLHHSGASAGGDLMVNPLVIDRPVDCIDVIRYALGALPLESDPGTQFSYSNFGYCILGRIIEEKSGLSYEEYVKERVLTPIGITRMQIGGTLLNERADGEVRYHWSPKHTLWPSDYPDGPRRLPPQYGSIFLPRYDSSGGWIGSTNDLLRFATSLDGSRPPAGLEPDTVELMLSRHDPPLTEAEHYYAMGWTVFPVAQEATWNHNGSFWGAYAILIRTHDGLAVAALFNSGNDLSAYYAEGNQLLWDGIRSIGTLPNHDLFPLFGYEPDARM